MLGFQAAIRKTLTSTLDSTTTMGMDPRLHYGACVTLHRQSMISDRWGPTSLSMQSIEISTTLTSTTI